MARPQKAGTRKERALATRRRILEKAHGLFRARGYVGTTMEAIAKEAGVAVQTLYFTFRTKSAVLENVVHASVMGFANWVPVPHQLVLNDVDQLRRLHDWFVPFESQPTPRRALEIFIDAGVDIMERTAPLVSVMHEAAGDPDAKRLYDDGEVRRADAYRTVIRVLKKKPGGLREGMTVQRATDVLLTLFSGETYQMLRDRGWKPRQVRAWLLDVLAHQLLPPSR